MKRFLAWLCAAVLCLALLPAPSGAADVHFTSVNDRLLPLTADTMPIWVDGVLYVPTSVFDNNTTGVTTLGMYGNQSRDGKTVTLYTLRQMVVLDLTTGLARDQHTGQSLPELSTITRNGRAYLPLAAVCEFFHLEYSYNYTEFGVLVRVKSENVILTDVRFIDAATSLMRNYLKEYLENQPGQSPGSTEPLPPVTPPVTDPEQKVQICLAFSSRSGEGTAELLDRLDQAGCQGLFLFAPEDLMEQDDLVRRIVGSGHWIGIRAEGRNAEESREILARSNDILRHVARTAATVVLVPESQRAQLSEDGWVCWKSTLNAMPKAAESGEEYAGRLIKGIGDRQGIVCLQLDDGEDSLRVFPELLKRMADEPYTIVAPLETRL